MGICTSTKNKNIKANQKDKGKEEENKDNEKKDSKTDDKDKEKEGNEEKNSKEEENKEKEKEENKEQEKKEYLYPEITFTIENNEYKETVKTTEKISSLFTAIEKYKKKKYSEYDLITDDEVCLSSKLNEDIGSVFPDKQEVSLKMLYMGLEISLEVKNDYEVTTTLLGEPLFDYGNICLLIFHKYENYFTCEILKNEKILLYKKITG